MMKKNILLFESAGGNFIEKDSDVGNYRIRTFFLNNDGEQIFLELSGSFLNNKKIKRFGWYTHINHCFKLEKSNDLNLKVNINLQDTFFKGYNKKDLTKYINENLNCNFDDIKILNSMEQYRVFGDYNTYNLMENHIVNEKRTKARIEAYKKIDQEIKEKLSSNSSKISIESADDESITIRCFADKNDLYKIGMDDENRTLKIKVNY